MNGKETLTTSQRVDHLQQDIGQLQLSLEELLSELRRRSRFAAPLVIGLVSLYLLLKVIEKCKTC